MKWVAEALAILALALVVAAVAWLATGDTSTARTVALYTAGGAFALDVAVGMWGWLTNDW